MEDIEKWENLTGKLYIYLLQNVKDREIAEDILYDAFLKIIEKRQFYRYKENYDGWAFRITKNVLIDYFRKIKTNVDLESIKKDLYEDKDGLDTYKHLIPALKEFIEDLPEKYSKPLILSDIQGIKQKLIAQKLGLSVSGAKSRIQRARKMLKEYFLKCSEYKYDSRGIIIEFYPKSTSCICERS
jgi:RNA polymerase sigma-70 factor (ECF subfamily)